MIKRIIDISEKSYLHIKNNQFLITRGEETIGSIPVEDLGIVILQHPAIVISQAAIISCQKNNTALVFCNERHLPYSIILPISDANSLHTKIIQEQVNVSVPTRKRLWKLVVQQKIACQIETLQKLGKLTAPLQKLKEKVRSGDPKNVEAQAARKYWTLLMGKSFRRDINLDGINSLLNYGYSIIRAMLARAIVGAGLHPALGIHHRNQYNGLCLADDLLEPFRPWVDFRVHKLSTGKSVEFITKESKESLLGLLSDNVKWGNKTMPLMVASHYFVADFKRALHNKKHRFEYPKIIISTSA